MKIKNEVIGWIFGGALFMLLSISYYSAVISPFLNKNDSLKGSGYQIFLNRTINSLNATCPMQINESIRMDSCNTANLIVRYYYTLSYDLTSAITQESIDMMSANILQEVKSSPALNGMRKNEVTFVYYYFDINGLLVFDKVVTPVDYQGGS